MTFRSPQTFLPHAWPQHSPNSLSLGEVRRRRQLGSGHNRSAAGVSAGTFVLAALNKCLLAFTHHCLALLSKCIKRFLPRQAGALSQQQGREDALLFIRTALTKFCPSHMGGKVSASPVFLGGARGIKAEPGSGAAAQPAAVGRGWWLQTPGAPAPQAGVLSPMLFNVNCFSLLSKHASHFPVSMLGNLWNFTLP